MIHFHKREVTKNLATPFEWITTEQVTAAAFCQVPQQFAGTHFLTSG